MRSRDAKGGGQSPTGPNPEGNAIMAKQSAVSSAVTFSPEQLQAYVDAAIAKAFEVKQAQEDHKRSDDADKAVVRAFTKAGYKPETIKARETVLTYNKWLEQGRKVRSGETSVRVKSGRGVLRLFHRDQTDAMNAVEKKAALASLAEKIAKKQGKPAPQPAPVAAKTARAKAKPVSAVQPAV